MWQVVQLLVQGQALLSARQQVPLEGQWWAMLVVALEWGRQAALLYSLHGVS
jgi:hypothetical protein